MPREPEDDDLDLGPTGPTVVLDRLGDSYVVFFDPPLADGEHRATYWAKDQAWQDARQRAEDHRLGFREAVNPKTGNRNATRD